MSDKYLTVKYQLELQMDHQNLSPCEIAVAVELTPLHSRVMETFGGRIERLLKEKSRRLDREVSQRELARAVELSHATVNAIVGGESAPQLEFIEKAADFFELSGREYEAFMEAGKLAWLSSNKEKTDYVLRLKSELDRLKSDTGLLRSRLRTAVLALNNMARLIEQKGIELPRDIKEAISDLERGMHDFP